jgi:D-xylose 1-dehydrogenase
VTATYSDLAGRTVFISGGATGIGREIVTAFHAQEARVVFVDIDVPAGSELVELLATSGPRPTFVECDVTDDDALRAALGDAELSGEGVDVVVNNAANDTRFDTDAVDADVWDWSVSVNLKHQFVAAQAAFRFMKRRQRGSIINFGSVAPVAKIPDLAVYSTCKAGVRGLTRSLAREYGPDFVRVNTIVPGAILTDRQLELWYEDDAAVEAMLRQQCLHRRMNGADIANMALFLASDVSSGCTAQEFVVDAGLT